MKKEMDIKTRKKEYYSKIGENIKNARIAAGVTQKQLSDLLSVSPVTISRYENGERTPGLSTLVAISVFLNIGLKELLAGNESPDDAVMYHDEDSKGFYFIWPDDNAHTFMEKKYERSLVSAFDVILETIGYSYVSTPTSTRVLDKKTGVVYNVSQEELNRMLNSAFDYFKFNLNGVLERSEVVQIQPVNDL